MSRSTPDATQARQDSAQARLIPATASHLVATYGLLVVFVFVIAVFGLLRPKSFLSATNLDSILVSQAITALLALAEMIPLATRQFDLSVGYHLGVAQVLAVGLQVREGMSIFETAGLILMLSLLIGGMNGILVTRFKIDSFIATMGTGTLLYGISNWYSNGEQIVGMNLPDIFIDMTQVVHGMPLPALYVSFVAVILWIVTERLPLGRNLYVIGANPRAAELIGININSHVLGAFIASGLMSGIAGLLLGSMLQTGTPSVGPEYLLPAFAATLLGATSIKPGRVNVVGTLLSVLVLAFSFSGVQQLGAPFYVQYFFNGSILIIAVGLSVYAARRRQSMIYDRDVKP